MDEKASDLTGEQMAERLTKALSKMVSDQMEKERRMRITIREVPVTPQSSADVIKSFQVIHMAYVAGGGHIKKDLTGYAGYYQCGINFVVTSTDDDEIAKALGKAIWNNKA